jgi:hypothetical protein
MDTIVEHPRIRVNPEVSLAAVSYLRQMSVSGLVCSIIKTKHIKVVKGSFQGDLDQ